MNKGYLTIDLSSSQREPRSRAIAVAEVRAAAQAGRGLSAERHGPLVRTSFPINKGLRRLSLDAGSYIVRLYLPNGDVRAEQVEVEDGGATRVTFNVGFSSSHWFDNLTNTDVGRAIKNAERDSSWSVDESVSSNSLSKSGDNATSHGVASEASRALASAVALGLRRSSSDVNRISGTRLAGRAKGWCWITHLDRNRLIPNEGLSTEDLVRWWTGNPLPVPAEMERRWLSPRNVRLSVNRNSRLAEPGPLVDPRRFFAAIRDPVGREYYAVLPVGWRSTNLEDFGKLVEASVRLHVVIDTALTSDASTPAAQWRCSPVVNDAAAMSLLGFLNADQVAAGQSILMSAHAMLFHKMINPVSAAAGAYLLLSHPEDANATFDPEWRRWIVNLYRRFPDVPDGAIAMAQMSLVYGESGRDDDVDVERIRNLALEAVRRGLPFLSTGIRRLTEILVALEGDDQAERRTGPLVDQTRAALSLVRQLGRITVPSEFFTVLRWRNSYA
jgi:hypothetical protein